METKANYVLIGAFTLLATVSLLMFGLWAAKYSSERNWQKYEVIFTEPVTGLTEGSSVQYNGIAVGTVETLDLAPNDPRRVIAKLKLKADTPVKVDTHAKLSLTSLTGVPFVQLTGGTPGARALVDADHREIPVIQTEASALQSIADTANRLVARLDKILSDTNVQRINDTLAHIDEMASTIAGQRQDIRALIVSARQSSEQLSVTLKHTDDVVVDRLPAIVDKLDTTLAHLDSAASGANAIVNDNRAAIHSFANGGLSQLGPTLADLRSLVRDLRQITDRLQAGSPARYIFGRDNPKEFEPK